MTIVTQKHMNNNRSRNTWQ